MSLSSDATLTMPVQPAYGNGNGGMWGGDWGAWIILFLIFGMFGWGGYGGFGGGNGVNGPGFQGFATRADINEGFALNGLQNGQTSWQRRLAIRATPSRTVPVTLSTMPTPTAAPFWTS